MKPSDISMLIVDDEQLILDSVSELFKSFGFNVETASSGNSAWTILNSKKFNIVLSDVRMPDGDGVELVKKIKETFGNKISVLFMTGFSDLMNEEIFHMGAEGKFLKPFDDRAVRNAIQQCLLAPEHRWSMPSVKAESKAILIEKVGTDIKSLEDEKSVLFGRGGFYVSYRFSPPPRGSVVKFSIAIKFPTKVHFSGLGVVRWIQVSGRNGLSPGLGIEIINMDQAASKVYFSLFQNVIPFIPSVNFSLRAAG